MRKETRNVYVWIIRLLLLSATTCAVVASEAQTVKEIINKEADRYELDRGLLLAIATVESNLNPRAKGASDDVGLFQLRQRYFGSNASTCAKTNARTAAAYLAWLRERPACKQYGRYWYVCFNRGLNRKPLTNVKKFDYTVKVERARTQYAAGRQLANQ